MALQKVFQHFSGNSNSPVKKASRVEEPHNAPLDVDGAHGIITHARNDDESTTSAPTFQSKDDEPKSTPPQNDDGSDGGDDSEATATPR